MKIPELNKIYNCFDDGKLTKILEKRLNHKYDKTKIT
jgi:hypothetical protein